MVSSPKSRAPVSFAIGWLSVLAWGMQSAGAPIIGAQMIMFLVNLHFPSFKAEAWQTYLLYCLIVTIVALIVIFASRQIPKAEIGIFVMSLVGFVVFTILVLTLSKTKQPANVVFTDFENITGWNDGIAFMLGVSQAMYSYLSLDSVTHVAEGMFICHL